MSKKHTVQLVAGAEATFALGAPDENGVVGTPTFAALAYSGGMVPGYTATPRLPHDYVIDLKGTGRSRNVLVNLEHDASKRVGHVTKVDNDGSHLMVEGVLSAASQWSSEVANSAKLGMPWEVSIEGNLSGREFIPAGKSAVVNGQTFSGPFFRFSKNTFTDIAFVSRGADEGNAVKVAASAAGASQMSEFEQFVVSCGSDPETITSEHRTTLQKAYDALHRPTAPSGAPDTLSFAQAAENVRLENKRQDDIQKIALKAMADHPIYERQIQDMATAALANKQSPDEFELELLRSLRVQPGIFVAHAKEQAENDPEVMKAALAMRAGLPDIEKHYSEQVLNTVDRLGMRRFGLQALMMKTAASNGYHGRPGEGVHEGNLHEVLQYCFPPATHRARMGTGFSSIDMSGILGSVANKEILQGYMEEDDTWREIATVRSVSNLLQYTSYRMLDSLEYEELGAAGEIKHGKLSQETFTRQAKTYAKMLGITRTDILNDDLGAFDDVRERLGRGGAKKFNNVVWATFINNSAFFTSGNTNYVSGSTTNLGADGVGLGLGVTGFRKMTSPAADGTKRVGVGMRPAVLLVPPELEFVARQLFVSSNYITGANATTASGNVFQNLYRVVVQNRLSDSAFTGYSTTAWYLLSNEMKPVTVSFLNGQQTPTVESASADFHQLGIQFRAFHDFGADLGDYLGALKSKGAA